MNAVIALGAALCVPLVIIYTLEAEGRADRWFRRVRRWIHEASR